MVERYRTLAVYGAVVSEEEHEAARGLPALCRLLYVDAKTRDLRLVDTKAKFRIVTETQAVEFAEAMAGMKRAYQDGGPGISGDLDNGLRLVAEFTAKVRNP